MCAWCQKVGVKRYSLSMGSELKSFCSEKCFAACRRAYFKRNKVILLLPSPPPSRLLLLLLLLGSSDVASLIGCVVQGWDPGLLATKCGQKRAENLTFK